MLAAPARLSVHRRVFAREPATVFAGCAGRQSRNDFTPLEQVERGEEG